MAQVSIRELPLNDLTVQQILDAKENAQREIHNAIKSAREKYRLATGGAELISVTMIDIPPLNHGDGTPRKPRSHKPQYPIVTTSFDRRL